MGILPMFLFFFFVNLESSFVEVESHFVKALLGVQFVPLESLFVLLNVSDWPRGGELGKRLDNFLTGEEVNDVAVHSLLSEKRRDVQVTLNVVLNFLQRCLICFFP